MDICIYSDFIKHICICEALKGSRCHKKRQFVNKDSCEKMDWLDKGKLGKVREWVTGRTRNKLIENLLENC